MGAAGCRGAFGVTLQFALALIARGSCATERELNLRSPPRVGPAAPGHAFGDLAGLSTARLVSDRRNGHHAKRSRIEHGDAQPSGPPRPAQPASGGPPARGAKRARRAVF